MKMIELFIKIANKEKVPKEIKWRCNRYEYSSIAEQYYIKDKIHNVDNSLRATLYDFSDLNNEIEIIEEPKKIEKIDTQYYDDERYTPETRLNICMNYINKLIDEVNKLKGEE
jgi:hypothetical protein